MGWNEDFLKRKGWDEDRLQRLQKFTVEREERRLAKARRLVLVLAIVASLGVTSIVIEMMTRDQQVAIPINFMDQKGTVAEWMQSGFVKSIDDSAFTIVIDETLWNEMSGARKKAVAMLLRAYYPQRGGGNTFRLTVRGHSSQKLLVSIDGSEADAE
jgi:hypothetical protein